MRGEYCKKNAASPYAWEYNFPPGYGHTSVSFLKRCPGFREAKHGNMQAALNVVDVCVKPNRIDELRKRHPSAVLLPVITDNSLPVAFAQQIGMVVHACVRKNEATNRKGLTAMERMLHTPYFSGEIVAGTDYIIVDDIVTQGGTVSALRKHVMLNRGTVVAVTALAFSADSRIIAPEIQDVHDLIKKFTYSLLITALREHCIADDVWELTRSQIKYLLRFNQLESIINCMSKSERQSDFTFMRSFKKENTAAGRRSAKGLCTMREARHKRG